MPTLLISILLALLPQAAPAPPNHAGSPKVSPDGAWISFGSDRSGKPQIYVIAPDGSQERQVTDSPDRASVSRWASDGKHLIVTSFANGIGRLAELPLDGHDRKEIVAVPARSGALSPDGTRVVYDAGNTYTTTQLTVATIADVKPASPKLINDGKSIAWNTAWSPDGRTIAFTCRDAESLLQVCVVSADGTAGKQLTHHTKTDGNAQVPDWSRDGQWIAYQSNGDKGFAELWVMHSDGSGAHRIVAHTEAFLDETPSWFPDGTRVAFQSTRSGAMEVWTVNVDGTGLKQVTGVGR